MRSMADLQQRTTAWHLARRGRLTASNLGAALGQVSYVSRQQAYKRAMGTETFTGNEATEWGTRNESNGIMEYQALTGNLVQATGLHIHGDHNWLAGSPDGFVGEEGMIEVKCPFYFKRNGAGRLHKAVPPHYYQQMNALMEICNREWCDYVCWAPEGMVVYRVKRDREIFDYLLTYYSQFYSAMMTHAEGPPPLSTYDRSNIQQALCMAIERSVDYKHWSGVDPSAPLPSSDVSVMQDEDDETRLASCKRKRVSDAMAQTGCTSDQWAIDIGEVASLQVVAAQV